MFFAKWQVATKSNVTKSRLHCTQYTEHMSWHKTSKLIFDGLNYWFLITYLALCLISYRKIEDYDLDTHIS
jgi:hypothetical protein